MAEDRAALFVPRADMDQTGADVEAVLRRLPGVRSVRSSTENVLDTAARRVDVEFDPGQTNPIVMRDALAREGIDVLNTDETTT